MTQAGRAGRLRRTAMGPMLLAVSLSTAVWAAPPSGGPGASDVASEGPVIKGTGTCPRAEVVAVTLQSFNLSKSALHDEAPIEVADLGDRFRISMPGQVREYDDPTHDCAERARIAAVFIALALSPPELPGETPATRRTRVTPAAPPPSTARAAGGGVFPWGRFEAAGRFDGAPGLGDSQGFVEGGAMIRMALGWSASWGVELGLGVLASRMVQLEGVTAREQRFPFQLSLCWRTLALPVEISVAAGLAGAWFTTEATELPVSDRQSRLDIGAGVGLKARWPATSRLAPFIGAGFEYFPRAYTFDVGGRGAIGSTSSFRLTGELGLSVALE